MTFTTPSEVQVGFTREHHFEHPASGVLVERFVLRGPGGAVHFEHRDTFRLITTALAYHRTPKGDASDTANGDMHSDDCVIMHGPCVGDCYVTTMSGELAGEWDAYGDDHVWEYLAVMYAREIASGGEPS